MHLHVSLCTLMYPVAGQNTSGLIYSGEEHMNAGDLLTTKEAAQVLRVSPWTISAWLSQGKLRRTKVGSRTLIRESELDRFVREQNMAQAKENSGGDNAA